MRMYFIMLSLFLSFVQTATKLPAWHMKPILSHIKPEMVDEYHVDSMITPEDFAAKYVLPRKPIIFRNVVQRWPAFKLWTDEYLKENYGDMELRLEGKKEKSGRVPKGDVCLGRDTLRTFLNEYKSGADKYVVSELPLPMWNDVHVPPPMGCGEFLTNFVEIDIWINSDMGKKGKGGNSILHKDAFNTVNCVLNGTKDWKLIELKYNNYIYQSWEPPDERGFGGYSLVHPDKVDAKRFPNFGKIPRWQLANMNAGDCLYLPSQMWHQVKSYGETNRAIAFLFNRFEDQNIINTSNCPENVPDVRLSDVDVDLQYPGYGPMTMGDFEIVQTKKGIKQFVNKRKGVVTKRNIYQLVKSNHENLGPLQKELLVQKTKNIYQHLLSIAGGDASKLTMDMITNLTHAQIRAMYTWIFKVHEANSCNLEYSHFTPETIIDLIWKLRNENDGKLEKGKFTTAYEEMGGTNKFAEIFWKKLAGNDEEITNVANTIKYALQKYEEHRSIDPDEEEDDDEATIVTPQGHVTQPKKLSSSYANREGEGGNGEEEQNGGEEIEGQEGGIAQKKGKDEL